MGLINASIFPQVLHIHRLHGRSFQGLSGLLRQRWQLHPGGSWRRGNCWRPPGPSGRCGQRHRRHHQRRLLDVGCHGGQVAWRIGPTWNHWLSIGLLKFREARPSSTFGTCLKEIHCLLHPHRCSISTLYLKTPTYPPSYSSWVRHGAWSGWGAARSPKAPGQVERMPPGQRAQQRHLSSAQPSFPQLQSIPVCWGWDSLPQVTQVSLNSYVADSHIHEEFNTKYRQYKHFIERHTVSCLSTWKHQFPPCLLAMTCQGTIFLQRAGPSFRPGGSSLSGGHWWPVSVSVTSSSMGIMLLGWIIQGL